ncbi:replication protein A 70 kDa DNA-binding subunit E-like [Helianthus annuus]|uniref:replication protein A 70 kDa DNA-binding subunit E-like n=1 Tax=Helianthus annuus TaxID=4232 RepID=UPI0016531C52|nr:replication protein A 70 kDa DNA-binding subunit E-like [Helianthus annuus]
MEEQGEITFLNDIDALSTNYTIKVKIISLWRKKMKGNERETYRIDMVLMDEMGTKIQASCLHRLFSKFERHLNVDECLIIKRPPLAANTASFKIVPNNQKLSFYYHTFVEKCSNWDGPQFVFDFVDFKDVLSQRYKEGTTIDFIGYVVVCYKIEDTNKKNGTKGKRLNLKLQDLENVEVDLTLWDNYAKDMSSYMVSQDREAHVVIAVHFGVVKTYKGKWGISNNFDGTRLFINDNFDQMLTFKEKFIAKLVASAESSSHVGSFVICSVEDEFMNNDPKKVIIVGTIVAIVSYKMWYYDGCNYCKSKVEQNFETYDREDGTSDVRDEKMYQCSNKDCPGKDVFPMSRFKIPIRVQDSTGTVTLTLFDHEALKFVGKTAKELIQIQDEILKTNEVPRAYPVEFETLLNLKCAFVIRVTYFNITNAVENYGISVVTNDVDILDQLNKKWKIDQIDVSDSFAMSQSDFQDAGGETAKDGVSYTGDNSTPVSKDSVADLYQSSSDLKHNLGDVYAIEDGIGSSESKPRISGGSICSDEAIANN